MSRHDKDELKDERAGSREKFTGQIYARTSPSMIYAGYVRRGSIRSQNLARPLCCRRPT